MMEHRDSRRVRLSLLAVLLAAAAFLLTLGSINPGRGSAAQELELDLELFATGFVEPVDIAFDPDEGRAFVVEQTGYIRQVDSGVPVDPPFLDIAAQVSGDTEQGVLGLVFHPDYAANRYLYVNYTDLNGDTVIARFTANAQNTQADPNSEFPILTVDQPYNNHNGGDLAFGPDGYLYIPLGDGGWFNDPENRAQNPQTLLGKLLRIDVDGGSPYAIPPDNPFVDDPGTLDEIWALGVRNPWRVSFDRQTGEFYIADVGQYAWEEVNVQPAGEGGQNYGWSCYEGMHENPGTNMPECGQPEDYRLPDVEYDHLSGSCAITGGFVYRGSIYTNMVGRYLMTDYCTGYFWDLHRDQMGDWVLTRHDHLANFGYVTFGEDNAGELYVGNWANGNIYHLVDNSPIVPTVTPTASPTPTMTPQPGESHTLYLPLIVR